MGRKSCVTLDQKFRKEAGRGGRACRTPACSPRLVLGLRVPRRPPGPTVRTFLCPTTEEEAGCPGLELERDAADEWDQEGCPPRSKVEPTARLLADLAEGAQNKAAVRNSDFS